MAGQKNQAKSILGGSVEPKVDMGNGFPGPDTYSQTDQLYSIPGFVIMPDSAVVYKD